MPPEQCISNAPVSSRIRTYNNNHEASPMSVHKRTANGACIVALVVATASAQKPPAIHALGRPEQVSSHILSSVSTVVLVPGGLLVNDIIAHRVLLFDSTLTRA